MLTPAMPTQHGNGLAMRLGFFLSVYAERFDVDLIVIPVAGDANGPNAFVQSRARRVDVVALGRPDTHFGLVMGVRDLPDRLEAFGNYGRPSLARFNGSAERAMAAFTRDVRYAAVHVSRLYLAELARPWIDDRRRRCPVVLDCDDDDISAHQRIAAIERRSGKLFAASWADLEAAAFARIAEQWLPKFDVAFSASDKEKRSLSLYGCRGVTVANVIKVPTGSPLHHAGRRVPTLIFVGTLGYAPNADGIAWFVSRVWRRLQRNLHFRVRLLIVGRDPSSAVMRLRSQRGIELAGNVPDVGPLYRRADLAIAPLRAGGGTRIKIIEAAAHGVPMVATRLAAEGTTFRPRAEMLIADDPETFLRACLELLRKRTLAVRLANHARRKARHDYSAEPWARLVANHVACGREEHLSVNGGIDGGNDDAGT